MMVAGLVGGSQDIIKIEGEPVAKDVAEIKSVEKRSPHYYSHHYHHGYHHGMQKVSHIVGLRPQGWHFLWDINKTNWCNGFCVQFRQTFAKETFSYDEHLKT